MIRRARPSLVGRGMDELRERKMENRPQVNGAAPVQVNGAGPVRKFQLIKEYGPFIRAAGLDPNTMSCAEIEANIAFIKAQLR